MSRFGIGWDHAKDIERVCITTLDTLEATLHSDTRRMISRMGDADRCPDESVTRQPA